MMFIKNSFLHILIINNSRLLLSLLVLLFACSVSKAQVSCGPVFIQNVCITNSASIGTSTELSASYFWFKDGKPKKGPIAGDGGAVSFSFPITSIEDAGNYTIEQTKNGIVTCVQNIQVVLVPLPVIQVLTGASLLCNGETILSLSNSEAGVVYELYCNNQFESSISRTESGPFSFYPVSREGVYSVKAYKISCNNNSTVEFGNIAVYQNLPRPIINSTTATSAIINWSATGSYILEYGPKGFFPGFDATAGVGGTIINTSAATVTLSGLVSGNSYDVYFRQSCSPGVYASSTARTFTTDCSPITNFPFNEGFESTPVLGVPSCWKSNYTDFDNDLDFFSLSGFPRSGVNYLYGQRGWLILPRMTLTGNQRLRFFANPSSSTAIYNVKISSGTNALSSFTTTLFTDTIFQVGYREKSINLSAYTGSVYIAIQEVSGAIRFDDFSVENIPACPGPSFIKTASITTNTAQVNWTGTGSFVLEYGLAGFTPGTTNTPGAGGNIVTSTGNTLTLTGLSTNTNYGIYLRQNCTSSLNGYSSNSSKISFSTFLNCATATVINTCVNVSASVLSGTGQFDFSGTYPNNSNGNSTSGKELLYQFTPTTTGVYYLDVATSGTQFVSYLYKPASSGCSNTGWIGINSINSANMGKHSIGILQAGTTYLFLLDNENFSDIFNQTFKICLSPVGGGVCTKIFSRLIPPNSPKKEYLLDDSGGVIAELDFSTSSTAPGNINYTTIVSSGLPVLKDKDNKEYLKHTFNIISANSIISGSVGIKLFFENSILQDLINDPHDGIADINNVGDLGVTLMSGQFCSSSIHPITSGVFINPSASGAYNSTSSFVQFSTSTMGAYYLNGGGLPLTPGDNVLCQGSSVVFNVPDRGAGTTYQWQVDQGFGFTNLSNLGVYSGVTARTLLISLPPTSYYGSKYRCISVQGGNTLISPVNTLKFSITWTGAFDSNWEDPKNWDCSVYPNYHIPDANTDVIIASGTLNNPVISNNLSCRSLTLKAGATITIDSGFKLTITGKGN
jgi:hypothetical protein